MFDVAIESIKRVNEEEVLSKYRLKSKEFILATIHRAENTDVRENLINIWEALNEIASYGYRIIFPTHPRTKKALNEAGIDINFKNENLLLIEPVSYFEMLALEKNAKLIITDSGGVQKEGYSEELRVLSQEMRQSALFVNKFVTYLCTLFMNYFLGLIGWI